MPSRIATHRPTVPREAMRAALAVACFFAIGLGTVRAQAQDGYGADMKAGRAAYNANDMATAEKHFDAAMKAAENDRQKGSAAYALGVVAQKQNKLPEAKQRAEQALAINPQDKQAKGLLDEVNAAPVAGKKPAGKGLAKTPLAPASKPQTAAAKPTASPKSAPKAGEGAAAAAGPALAPAATSGESPPLPKPAKPTPKPAAAKAPEGAAKSAATPTAAKKPAAVKADPGAEPEVTPSGPPATPTVPRKSSELMEGPAKAEPTATELGGTATVAAIAGSGLVPTTPAITPTEAIAKPVAVVGVGSLVTGSVQPPAVASEGASAVTPASHQVLPNPTDAKPLPVRSRYVEMVCGVDYRQDGRQFVRAFEITRGIGKMDADQADILAFDLTCERVQGGGHVPRTLLTGEGADVVKTVLRRAPEGGWTFGHHRTQRQVRIRIEGDTLTLVPSAAEVAVLRKKLAENPAQLDALSSDARHNLELAVAGEGFPEFRLVRDADGLASAFELAAKGAKRFDDSVSAAQSRQ